MPHYPTPAEFQPGPKPRFTSVELLDLTTARVNVPKYLPGDWVQFLDGAGNLQLQLDSVLEPKRTLRRGDVLYGPFENLVISNQAQDDAGTFDSSVTLDHEIASPRKCLLMVGSFPALPQQRRHEPLLLKHIAIPPGPGSNFSEIIGASRSRIKIHALIASLLADANVASRVVRCNIIPTFNPYLSSATLFTDVFPATVLAREFSSFRAQLGGIRGSVFVGINLSQSTRIPDVGFWDGPVTVQFSALNMQASDMFLGTEIFYELN